MTLFCGGAESTVAHAVRVVVKGYAVFHENSLRETGSCRYLKRFALVAVVGYLDEDMSLVVRL